MWRFFLGDRAQHRQRLLLSSASTAPATTLRIPEPRGLPLLGHIGQIDKECPLASLEELARKLGPIYRLRVCGQSIVVVSSHELVHEVCDDNRFKKSTKGELTELRKATGNGLLTAKDEDDESWGIAHRILVPALGPLAVRGMFGEMRDIASQLALKWARHGVGSSGGGGGGVTITSTTTATSTLSGILVADDFERLALDTVALCGMGLRLNSYYRSDGGGGGGAHPFADAMRRVMRAARDRGLSRGPWALRIPGWGSQHAADVARLRGAAEEVLRARRAEEWSRPLDIPTPTTAASDGGEDGGGGNNDGESGHGALPSPGARQDLLGAMLDGIDPTTGKRMSDRSIVDNLVTFLMAGHETTSATLSAVFCQLLRDPKAYRTAQREVDEVVGKGQIQVEHIRRLKYLSAVICETMRLSAPIPIIAREPRADTLIGGGRYPVKAGDRIVPLLSLSHRDPAMYGGSGSDDAVDQFRPERMLCGGGRLEASPHAWMPFGAGACACIGRHFAWQQMVLAAALLLQSFHLALPLPHGRRPSPTDGSGGLRVRAVLRAGLALPSLEARLYGGRRAGDGDEDKAGQCDGEKQQQDQAGGGRGRHGLGPLAVLYGSNSGTCEFMARRLAADARRAGLAAEVDFMDTAAQTLPTDRPVVFVVASYEGEAPENARHFMSWIESLDGQTSVLEDVSYAVFGCGHQDWPKTYHRIPTLLDASLSELGARRLAPLCVTDAKERDMFSDFESWCENELLPALIEDAKQAARDAKAVQGDDGSCQEAIPMALSARRARILRHEETREMEVLEVRPLTYRLRHQPRGGGAGLASTLDGDDGCRPPEQALGAPRRAVSKCHMKLRLPEGARYEAGDYIVVLPHNSRLVVARAMRRLGLSWDAHTTITGAPPGVLALPVGVNFSVVEILESYVELGQTATRKDLLALSGVAKDENTKQRLRYLATDGYDELVKAKELSALVIAESFPAVEIPFGTFLSMLPPMRLRQYTISSTPLVDPTTATLTFTVLDEPALSGAGLRHVGVASSYLAGLSPGDRILAAVRAAPARMHLPVDQTTQPVLFICNGSGIAPFRGFVQERAELLRRHREAKTATAMTEQQQPVSPSPSPLAPAVLFFGCRGPGAEDLYRDELDTWEMEGAVEVHRAYSRAPHLTDGCYYVQDRVYQRKDIMLGLWDMGTAVKIYVCGSKTMAAGAQGAIARFVTERSAQDGVDMNSEQIQDWLAFGAQIDRVVIDVFD